MVKKYLYYTVLGFLIYYNSFSQLSGKIEYTYIKNLGVDYQTTGVLFFNSNRTKFIELSPEQKRTKKQKEFDSIQNRIVLNSKGRPINYVFLKRKKMISEESLISKIYFVEEEIPTIDWEILDEFKNINKYKCQKAKGKFRGRTYEVWFANEIAVRHGPWKLQGLPGLILEAMDSKRELVFLTKKIELSNQVVNIDFDEFDKTITLREYIDLIPKKFQEKTKLISSKLPRSRSLFIQPPPRATQLEIVYEWEEKDIKKDD